MKKIIFIGLSMIFPVALTAAEKDVWYDANGKVVKVTPAEKEKKVFVPDWKKREQERLARMAVLRLDKSASNRSSRTQYGDPYAAYYPGYSGYGSYYSPGWICRPQHRRYHGQSGWGRYTPRYHSAFRFQGSYQKNGWSVRVRF